MADDDGGSTAKVILGAVVGAGVVAAGGYLVYSYLNPNVADNNSESNNPLLRPREAVVEKPAQSPAQSTDYDELARSVDSMLRSSSEPAVESVFPYVFEEYSVGLGKLHQCFCGKSVADGHTLSRCAGCKATYYCSPEHQKHAWNVSPLLHKNFCGKLNEIVDGGFDRITEYMELFAPQNAPNIRLNTALEGWSIICAALERKVYTNKYEEAKLVHYAGTTHAMLCGQLMREKAATFDIKSLLGFFLPSINFFENVLVIGRQSDRALELLPFASFELFGLWSSLGLSMKDSDPAQMDLMFSNAAKKYGIPAIEDILELITSSPENLENQLYLQSLQQWTQSVVTILTQKANTFPLAETMCKTIASFAKSSANITELAIFSQCLYDSAVQGHAAVVQQTGLVDDSKWTEKQFEQYQQVRQQILQQLMVANFPELQGAQ